MPGHDLGALQSRLLASGVAPETPCAIISGATSEREQVHVSTVDSLHAAPHLQAPKLLVVGEVVRFADQRRLRQQFGQLTQQAVEPPPGAEER
jgi:uroporphyrin-III C-methyltransferase